VIIEIFVYFGRIFVYFEKIFVVNFDHGQFSEILNLNFSKNISLDLQKGL
jgi:hypothetical protein